MGKLNYQSYIPYQYNKESKKDSCQEGELSKPQAEGYDWLAEPANSYALSDENLDRLMGL